MQDIDVALIQNTMYVGRVIHLLDFADFFSRSFLVQVLILILNIQTCITTFCATSKLTVNISKTKVLAFSRGGRLASRERWNNCNSMLDVVNGFIYVGVYFSNRLSLYQMTEAMSVKTKKCISLCFKFSTKCTMFTFQNSFF